MGLEVFADYHGADSPCHPDIDTSKLTIYGSIICPFVQRVLLVLEIKKLPYNFIGIDLVNKPKWYTFMYPAGKVPYLRHGEITLPESLIIANYLDEFYPPTIHPNDPYQKAKGLLLIDELTPLLITAIKCLKDTSSTSADKFKSINEMFEQIETIIARVETKFLQENEKPRYCDYMVWSFFNLTIPIAQWLGHPSINSIESLTSMYPNTAVYMKLMAEDPIVKKVMPTYDTLLAYYDKVFKK